MDAQSRPHDQRAGRRLALLLVACVATAVLACAGPALAAPGLTALGGPEIGLPTGPQRIGAVAVHRGDLHAAVIQERRDTAELRVLWFDESSDAWLPVAGPLNNIDTSWVYRVSLLSMRGDELYAAWSEHDGRTLSWRAVVARLTPDGRGWERIMQTHMRGTSVRLAQVGEQAWVAWTGSGGDVRLARINAGRVDALPADALPLNGYLHALVGHGAVAYVAYMLHVDVRAHRDRHGNEVPAGRISRLRVARLAPVPDRAAVQVTPLGSWDDVNEVFLSAGAPGAPAPILAWNSPRGIAVMRLREDGDGYDQIPIARLIALRRIRALRGIAATPAGITIAANSNPDARVRIYTLTGDPRPLTITDGDPLPHAYQHDTLTMLPVPRPADPSAVILGYDHRESPTPRAAAMRYSP